MRPPDAIQSAVLRIRGFALPDGGAVDLYADGDRWTTDPVTGAELVAEGWLLPGLVDCHTHPGAETRGQPLDETVLREDLRQHVAAGVTMIRAPRAWPGNLQPGSAVTRMSRGRSTPGRGSPSTASSSTAGDGGPTTASCRGSPPRKQRRPGGPK